MDSPEIEPTAARFLARDLYRAVSKAFENPDIRKNFEAYYLEKFGKPYIWKGKFADRGEETGNV